MRQLALCAMAAFAVGSVGCTSAPKFEKSNGTSGYSVRNLSGQTHFSVDLLLPSDTSRETLKHYGWRAIGEECLARGFQFFDVSDENPTRYVGFCYSGNERKSLALTFTLDGLEKNPPKFVVEDLNNKSSTLVKLGDEVTQIANETPTSMAHIKSIVYQATQSSNTIPLKVRRNGKEIEVKEPVALFKEGILGSEDLKALRQQIQ